MYHSQCKKIGVALLAAMTLMVGSWSTAQDDLIEESYAAANLLYLQSFEIAPGAIPNEAIAEAQEWVKAYRATGEYKSVRLFVHHTGPSFSLYMMLEPKSWQAIQDGQNKFFEAMAETMDQPFNWATHSDNLLTEVPVD